MSKSPAPGPRHMASAYSLCGPSLGERGVETTHRPHHLVVISAAFELAIGNQHRARHGRTTQRRQRRRRPRASGEADELAIGQSRDRGRMGSPRPARGELGGGAQAARQGIDVETRAGHQLARLRAGRQANHDGVVATGQVGDLFQRERPLMRRHRGRMNAINRRKKSRLIHNPPKRSTKWHWSNFLSYSQKWRGNKYRSGSRIKSALAGVVFRASQMTAAGSTPTNLHLSRSSQWGL